MVLRRRHGLYEEVAIRAVENALHERLIDRCWEELKVVFEDPEIIEAEAKIMRALANAFAPKTNGKTAKRRRRKKQ